jgi:hypothetical protein
MPWLNNFASNKKYVTHIGHSGYFPKNQYLG